MPAPEHRPLVIAALVAATVVAVPVAVLGGIGALARAVAR